MGSLSHTRKGLVRQRAIRLPARKPTTASGTVAIYMDYLGRVFRPRGSKGGRAVPILVGGLLTSTRGSARFTAILAMARSLP